MRRNKRILIAILFLAQWAMAFGQERLTLDSCLAAARQHNCTIKSAQLDVLISREVKKQMLWKYFPQVDLNGFAFGAASPLVDVDVTQMASAGLGGVLSDVLEIINALDSTRHVSSEVKWIRWGASAQARAVQPVYWGGQIVTANKLAKLGIDAAQLKQEVSERDVLQEVTETYWLVAGLMEKRATVTKVRSLLDTVNDIAQTAFVHGLVTGNDLLKVRLKQNEIETNALKLENGIHLAGRMLCHLIGAEYTGELLLDSFPANGDMVALLERPDTFYVEARPEVKLLDANVRYHQLMRRLTLGESLPHLAIGVSGGYSNFFERNRFNGIAFATLTIPLTQWGETSHKLRAHDYQIKQAELMRQDLHLKLTLQNRQIYSQLTEAIRLMEQHLSSCELARDNYQLSLMNYQAGVGTMSELLESESLLLQAENAYTDARISYLSALRKFNDYNK